MYFGHDRSMGEGFEPEYPEYQSTRGFPRRNKLILPPGTHLPMHGTPNLVVLTASAPSNHGYVHFFIRGTREFLNVSRL